MKKKILAFLLMSFLPSCFIIAQDKDSVVTLSGITVTSKVTVTKAVDRAFQKGFPDARNLRWSKMDKNYLAQFIVKDMNHNTLYAKNGYLKYDISFGKEHNLPNDVLEQVQSLYKDCKITQAINLKGSDRNFWVVNLEGMKYYYTISIEEGEINTLEKFEK